MVIYGQFMYNVNNIRDIFEQMDNNQVKILSLLHLVHQFEYYNKVKYTTDIKEEITLLTDENITDVKAKFQEFGPNEIKEILRLEKAYDTLFKLGEKGFITEEDIFSLHNEFYDDDDDEKGKYRTTAVRIKGPKHIMMAPELISSNMNLFIEELNRNINTLHPFEAACMAHWRFTNIIHPFKNGNGRIARLLMNMILIKNKYPMLLIPRNLRRAYIGALFDMESGIQPIECFNQFIMDLIDKSSNIFAKEILKL